MKNLAAVFGSDVFNDDVMRERLSKSTYEALKKTIQNGEALKITIANSVANAMKNWAIEKGVTHFTHWFQPMTGITAEKHDSFLHPTSDGKIIMEFSGKELIQGEPDASSFPSGGIRATFEARGYTAWDPTSYAFIKNGVFCIPTAFCSYSGEVLDKKTPLLRSMEVLNKHALRILKLFGQHDVTRVTTTVGAEQEYFLVDRELFKKRKDLLFTGRTLFGAKPPKGQELEDHYFGALKERVLNYMSDLDETLWKMGVLAKTRHNEVAPSQHELAPVFVQANVASDHNQLIMETMKSVALRHNLSCLLHEKPFAGINGSGKHINWSMSTSTGVNLLDPGSSPYENAQYLLFLTAIIKAVDTYQDLLRVSVSSAGNDHRLGANEAPPAIVSIFLGDELGEIVDSIVSGNGYNKRKKIEMEVGVDVLPHFPKDNTDRNRTSPFAYTGNKFELRMSGSSASVAGPTIILNTIVAKMLDEFATKLEDGEPDTFNERLNKLIKSELKKHKRIIFNGNNYSEEWVQEAEKRGLYNLKTTIEALPHFIDRKNIDLLTEYKIFSEKEVHARYEILVENYIKTLNIEALSALDMVKKQIIPSSEKYLGELSKIAVNKKTIGADIAYEQEIIFKLSNLIYSLHKKTELLEEKLLDSKKCSELYETAKFFRNEIFVIVNELRINSDELEVIVSEDCWPIPTYADLLFSV